MALKKTPLHDLHLTLGAKPMAFAGWEMPAMFRTGIIDEHLHTRRDASLFDVSHMGMLLLTGPVHQIADGLETVIPSDLVGLPVGRQRYGLLLDDAGGILDDLMVARIGDRFIVVVNAANIGADLGILRERLTADVDIRVSSDVLLALQGPRAEAALATLAGAVRDMNFLDIGEIEVLGITCVVSRSGYTGEDGFEIAIPRDHAARVAQALLAQPGVAPAGLAARDTLRLEAGLPLHGADISPDVTPVEADLAWAVSPIRRETGARPGGFPGAERVLAEISAGTDRRRVGLTVEGRAPVRPGATLFESDISIEPIGRVTSGGFGPSLGSPIAMGFVQPRLSQPGQRLFADVRGQRLALSVRRLPFVPARFKRRPPAPDQEIAC